MTSPTEDDVVLAHLSGKVITPNFKPHYMNEKKTACVIDHQWRINQVFNID